MPTRKTEAQVEKAICTKAKAIGWKVFKFSSPNNCGVADRLFIRNGVTLFIEVKAPRKRPTLLQEKFLRDMRKEKTPAFWTDEVDAALYYLRRLKSKDHISEVDFSLDKHALKA